MKPRFVSALSLLLLFPMISHCQSLIEGNWTGTLYQKPTNRTPFTEYKFSMNLKEKNGEVAGVSTLITGPNFGIIDLTGQFVNETFTFEEYHVEKDKHTTPFSWCLKSGSLKLTKVGTQLKLEGKWKGYTMDGPVRTECSPGTIVLIKEQGFISMKGYVVNEKNLLPIPAFIRILDKATKKEIGFLQTKTGEYEFKLSANTDYEVTVETQDYLTRYQNVNLRNSTIMNLPMKEIQAGQTVTLKSILFQKGTSILTTDSYPELERFGSLLTNNPTITIELQGHTSNEGDPAKNMILSEERVITIKNYLVTKGINPDRIRTKAFGAQKPIAPNDSDENRKLNRRVEFLIISI